MNTLLAYIRLLPALFGAVQHIEEAIPISGAGVEKLNLLVGIVKAAYDAEEEIRKSVDWGKLEGIIRTCVSLIVASLNKLGIFKKGQP